MDSRIKRLMVPAAIGLGIILISLLHYVTSTQSLVLHELFKRVYYVPIVIAAVTYGVRGGLATSIFASVLYLPHVVFDWHAWPVFELEQYGEVVLFNLVAGVTGLLADRLHAERNRYREAATELQEAYAHLKAHTEERLRVDRLVTIGRIASGIAHEVRNPLGGLLGCMEILEAEFPRVHPKFEFFAIARSEIVRLERVVSGFLDFAHPPSPASRAVDLNQLVLATSRLARPALACRTVSLQVDTVGDEVIVNVDADQIQRALLSLVLEGVPLPPETAVHLKVWHEGPTASILIDMSGARVAPPMVDDLFEPFSAPTGSGPGFALATARRLIENQHGTVRAQAHEAGLQYVIELPIATSLADGVSSVASEASPVSERRQ